MSLSKKSREILLAWAGALRACWDGSWLRTLGKRQDSLGWAPWNAHLWLGLDRASARVGLALPATGTGTGPTLPHVARVHWPSAAAASHNDLAGSPESCLPAPACLHSTGVGVLTGRFAKGGGAWVLCRVMSPHWAHCGNRQWRRCWCQSTISNLDLHPHPHPACIRVHSRRALCCGGARWRFWVVLGGAVLCCFPVSARRGGLWVASAFLQSPSPQVSHTVVPSIQRARPCLTRC